MLFSMLTTSKIPCIHAVFQIRHLMRWFMVKNQTYMTPTNGGKDVYVKIKQDDKLAHEATKAKWIGYSSQSNGHLIYWPSMHKVSVERNLIFDIGEKVKISPISPSDEPKVPMSKKPMIVPSIAPSVPSTPACNFLSQPSGKDGVEEIIKPSPEHELCDHSCDCR